MDDYIKNKKITKYVIVAFFSLFIIVIVLLSILKSNFTFSDSFLIVGDNLVWKKKGDKLYQIDPNKEKIDGNFTVYNGLKKINSSKVEFKNGEFKFYNGNNVMDNSDFRIAYRGFSDIKLTNYNIEDYDFNDEDFIIQLANVESEEDYDLYRYSLKKILLDGGETLYTMSDFAFGNGYRIPYSYLFLVKNNKIVDSIDDLNSNVLSLQEVMDLDGDGIDEIVVSKGVSAGNYFDMCYQVYNVINSKIVLKQSCDFLDKK